uniref:Uncharacterized protein n=1 Tax=Rhizophora mucronata TaxID=61149 RepID=A0A2P2QNT9_RHIMU
MCFGSSYFQKWRNPLLWPSLSSLTRCLVLPLSDASRKSKPLNCHAIFFRISPPNYFSPPRSPRPVFRLLFVNLCWQVNATPDGPAPT